MDSTAVFLVPFAGMPIVFACFYHVGIALPAGADKVYYSCPTDLIEPAVLLVVTASWVLPRLSFIRFCRFKSPYLCLDSSGSVDSSS